MEPLCKVSLLAASSGKTGEGEEGEDLWKEGGGGGKPALMVNKRERIERGGGEREREN